MHTLLSLPLGHRTGGQEWGAGGVDPQVASEQSKWQNREGKCARENTQKTFWYEFTICYFISTAYLFLGLFPREIPFSLQSWFLMPGKKTTVLLLLPLFFLLRSSQMVCLREINGFLNRLLCILLLVMFAHSSLLGPWYKRLPGNSRRGEATALWLRAPKTPRIPEFKSQLNPQSSWVGHLSKPLFPHLQG